MDLYIYNLIYKILGSYALVLTVLGTILNIILFIICLQKKQRKVNTFKFFAFISIVDTFALYEWNLKHFIKSFFGINPEFTNLIWCRLSAFIQYTGLQFSAWLLVMNFKIILISI